MEILDCTLRDGGYYTGWNFPKKIVDNYLKTLSNLPISIVELGYLSSKKDNNGPFYHLNKEILLNAKSLLRKNQKIYVMINFKEIENSKELENLIYDKHKNIDGLRFALAPKDLKKFLKIAKPVIKKYKKLEFNVNMMYLSKWIKDENLFEKVLKNLSRKIYTLSFVDSYGALMPEDIKFFLQRVKKYKNHVLKFGCHFHNNCGLALANSLIAANYGCDVVDATFKGMGRGAGNAETELLLANDQIKNKKISGFELNNLLEIFEKMKIDMGWGSSFAYAFAAKNGFPQSEMMDLMQKRRLDPGTAVKAISNKLTNINHIKFLNLEKIFSRNSAKNNFPIIIGGAPSLCDYGEYFFKHISNKSPIILSGSNALFNFLNLEITIQNPLIMILSGSEIKKINLNKKTNILKKINLSGVIAEKDFISNKSNFIKNTKVAISTSVALNPVLLTGMALMKMKINRMHLAFFDGNPETVKGRIVMNETEQSVEILKSRGLKLFTLTKSFLNLKQLNPWLND